MTNWEPRTDLEMLLDLLRQSESTTLEFKAFVNLGKDATSKDKVNFAADLVAMANHPPGGHILIGVNDDGTIADNSHRDFNPRDFDGAKLNDLVKRFANGQLDIRSKAHQIGGGQVVIIAVSSPPDGLPLVFSRSGSYEDGPPGTSDRNKDRNRIVFKEGTVLVREGAQNAHIRHELWPIILRNFRQRIIDEEIASLNKIKFSPTTPAPGEGQRFLKLTSSLKGSQLAEVLIQKLDAGQTLEVTQFIAHCRSRLFDQEESRPALIGLASAAVVGLMAGCQELIDGAVDAVIDVFQQDVVAVEQQKDFLACAYLIGAAALRMKRWDVLRDLVLTDYRSGKTDIRYVTWIRAAQVGASRSSEFDAKAGLTINEAHAIAAEFPSVCADIDPKMVGQDIKPSKPDVLLDSLCQFDLLHVMLVHVLGQGHTDAYPASTAFSVKRVVPFLRYLVNNPQVIEQIFPGAARDRIEAGVRQIMERAAAESLSKDVIWDLEDVIEDLFSQDAKAE